MTDRNSAGAGPLQRVLQRCERLGSLLENLVLMLLLVAMILLAAAQILLRNVFDTGFILTDELPPILVLWLAMLGAVVASRDDRHITIDVLSRFLTPSAQRAVHALVALFTAAVAGVVAWYSVIFVQGAYEYRAVDTVLDGLPAWIVQTILPLGFGLIAWRYLVLFARDLLAWRGRS